MDRSQRIYLHVGLPKTGSTYLQDHLRQHAEALRAHGYVYPLVGRESMFHAALEMTGQAHRRGLPEEKVVGTFDALVERGRRSGGTIVVSHEIFAGATPHRIEEIMRRLTGLEVHVVVTVRDPGSLLVAEWQERVKNGRSCTFAEYAAERVPAELLEPGRDDADHERLVRPAFAGKVGDVLERWGVHVPAERVHVVVCPGRGVERTLLWDRFATAIGLDPAASELRPAPSGQTKSNSSLGVEQVAFLRSVIDALGDRLPQPGYAHVAKRWFAQDVLGALPGTRPSLPEAYAAPLDWAARRWIHDVEASGATVHGDLDELRVVPDPRGSAHPDDVSPEQVAEVGAAAVAEMLLEVQQLRRKVKRLRGELRSARAAGAAGSARAGRSSVVGRVMDRVRRRRTRAAR